MFRLRTRLVASSLVAALALLGSPTTASAADPPAPATTPAIAGRPSSIAVLGDSISTATGTGTLGSEVPNNSWATGTNTTVNSSYRRLLALNPSISGKNYNMATNGRRMEHMDDQGAALPLDTQYVMVELGGNDLCKSSLDQMTPVETYRQQFVSGLNAVTSRVPNARIFVASIPDVYNLWYIRYAPASVNGLQSDQASQARTFANTYEFIPCLSLLANAASTAAADEARRQAVRARNIAFNQVLAEECAKVLRCRYDDDAIFNFSSNRDNPPFGPIKPRAQWNFTDNDISRNTIFGCPITGLVAAGCGDHFHPSLAGQVKIATHSWNASYSFSDVTAPTVSLSNPGANGNGWSSGAATVSLTGSDASGIRGFEHRIHRPNGTVTAWTATVGSDAQATVLDQGVSWVEARALDRNGNLSASKVLAVRVDAGSPSISATSSPAPNEAGWNSGPVTVTFTCSDTVSGVASCPSPVVLDDDGADQSATGTVTDLAGNTATVTVDGIDVDATSPSITASASPAANPAGWNNSAVTVSFDCDDALSGVASCSDAVTLTDDGAAQEATGTATDIAGNSATVTMAGIAIDQAAPAIDWTGGTTYDVDETVSVACVASDALSGVAFDGCATAGLSIAAAELEPGVHVIETTAVDAAGNETVSSVSFTVVVTADAMCNLAEAYVENRGIANSLCVQVRHGSLGAFRNHLEAQAGKAIGEAQAEQLTRLSASL